MEYVNELVVFPSSYHSNLLLGDKINTNERKYKIAPNTQ